MHLLNVFITSYTIITSYTTSMGTTLITDYINGVEVERVSSFRFLGTIISSSLKWGDNLSCITKKSPPEALFSSFFSGSWENVGWPVRGFCNSIGPLLRVFSPSLLSGMETPLSRWWLGNRLQLDRMVDRQDHRLQTHPPPSEIYMAHMQRKGMKILLDVTHPANHLLRFLPSGRRLRAMNTKTSRFLNSTYCSAIRFLNSSPSLHQ